MARHRRLEPELDEPAPAPLTSQSPRQPWTPRLITVSVSARAEVTLVRGARPSKLRPILIARSASLTAMPECSGPEPTSFSTKRETAP